MQKLVVNAALSLGLALFSVAVPGHGVAPDAMLRAVADEIFDNVKPDRESRSIDHAKAAALIEARVVPLFDFDRMTRLAVARNWRLASPEQQSAITGEFRTLIVRTYSTALTRYRGEPIDFRQLRGSPPGTEATVRSEVKQAGNEPMVVDYEMERTPEGWKIFGIKIAGVCLVTNYRDIFGEKVRDGGVDNLIKFLADSNRGDEARFNSIKNSFWEKSRVVYAIFQDLLRGGRR